MKDSIGNNLEERNIVQMGDKFMDLLYSIIHTSKDELIKKWSTNFDNGLAVVIKGMKTNCSITTTVGMQGLDYPLRTLPILFKVVEIHPTYIKLSFLPGSIDSSFEYYLKPILASLEVSSDKYIIYKMGCHM